MHIHQLDTLYKNYRFKNSPGVIWGHMGSNGNFHQKCYFSFRVLGMVMQFMHIDQLDTSYKSHRIKNSSGVTWGHRGQKIIFTKKKTLFLQQITWYGHVTHAYLSDRYLYRSNRSKYSSGVVWGHRGSKDHFCLKGYNS